MCTIQICSPKKIVSILMLTVLSSCGIAQLEESVERHTRELDDMRVLQAEYAASLDQIRSDVRRLSGNVEDLEHNAKGKTEELRKTIEQFSSRVPPPPIVPEDLLSEDESAISRNSSVSAQMFREGLKRMRSGDFSGAIGAFSQFLNDNPTTIMSDNAHFWIGIAYLGQGQNDRAVLAFSKVYEQFPAEDRAPWGIFYLASTFEKAGEREDAKLTYQKLVEDYPNTSAASRARGKLAEMGVRQQPAVSKDIGSEKGKKEKRK